MTKLTVKDPSGKVHTRTTKRTYTHVVFARKSREWHLNDAKHRPYFHDDDFWYHKAFVDGTSKWLERNSWESEEQHKARVDQKIKWSKYYLRDCGTPDELWALIETEQMEVFEKIDFEAWHVMGWCGRFDLAHKMSINDRWTDKTIMAVE